MANQTNPFVSGLNAWASAMDPADIAKGQLAGQSVANKSLEAQILQDRINARAGIRANMATPEEVQNFILMNESASPQASQAAAAAGRSEPILRNPNSSQRDVASAMYGMGQSANPENVRMWNDIAPPIPNVQFREDASGTPFAIVPDKNSPLGWTPKQFGQPAPGKIHTLMPGGTAFQEVPGGGMKPIENVERKASPPTEAQIATINASANRMALGANFQGIEQYVQQLLGAYDANGNRIANKPLLNPQEMQSIVNDAQRTAKGGYLMLPAINAALRRHGISPSTVVPKEFDSMQTHSVNPFTGALFNPFLESEGDAYVNPQTGEASPQWLPGFNTGQSKYLAGQNTVFWDPSKFRADVEQSKQAEGALKTDFTDPNEVVVPIRSVARLTGLSDDMSRDLNEPVFAKSADNPNTVVVPGNLYFRRLPSGVNKFYVAKTDANGGTTLVPESE